LEFAKEVYRREKFHPPNLTKFSEAQQELTQIASRVVKTPIPDYTPAQLGRGMLLAVEIAGLFTIGEMIGRRQVVGYKH
jgi:F-type H+-transporting ATPase subunit g